MGLWTLTHLLQILPTLAVFTVIAIIASRTLGKCSERVRYLPLQIIAVVLLLLEVGKQIVSFSGGTYNLYSLPFHYCSLFLYLLPFHAFYRGKFRAIIDAASFGCLASLMLDMLLMPAVIYSDGNIKNYFGSYMDFHTVTFHNLVMLYFILTVVLRLYEINVKRDMKVMASFLAVYVVVAAILSYSLKVNFHNLYECNIGFIENVRVAIVDAIGVFGTLIYVAALFVLTILFAYLAYFLTRLVIGLIDRRELSVSENSQ